MLMNYKAIVKGLNGVRLLVPENEVLNRVFELQSKDYDKDFYISIFKYNQDHYNRFKETKTLSGIEDNKSNTIVFDFDNAKDISKAKDDALTLIGRLTQKGFKLEDISIFFSGNKGYHVEIPTSTEYTKQELVNIREALAGDLESSDTAIKDTQRILRAPMTKHHVTGLFKTPITFDELTKLTIKQTQDLAKEVDESRYEMLDNTVNIRAEVPPAIAEIAKKGSKKKEKEVIVSDDRPIFEKNRTGLTNAKYALSEGYFEEGEAHEACCILAATMQGLGWNKELVYNNLKATLRLRARRLGLDDVTEEKKKEVWQVVESIFSPLWKGGLYSEDTNELLIKTKKRYDIQDKFDTKTVVTINELKTATEDFLKNLKDNRIYTGLEDLDKNLILTKGMLFGVLGCPGSGKTSFLNVFVENTSKNHGPVLYFSMDMSKDLLGTKIIQRYTGYSLEKLEDMILHGTYDKKYLDAVDRFTEDYKNVGFCFENGYTIEKISSEIERYQDKIGQRISMVGVDYLEKVNGPFSEETANSGFVASNLANLAKKHDTCIGLLLQPSKASGLPSDELKSYRAIKGASKIEQDARAIIGLWRPGYDPEDFMRDRYMSIAILKQNMGKLGRFDYMWDGARGNIGLMTDEQRRLFRSFLEELENQKKEKEDL